MHGLTTINQLNTLAAQNAPGEPQRQLAEAAEVHAARGTSQFDQAYAETRARNQAERERAIANLLRRPSEELISLARANNSLPSTLETALANRLETAINTLRGLGVEEHPIPQEVAQIATD